MRIPQEPGRPVRDVLVANQQRVQPLDDRRIPHARWIVAEVMRDDGEHVTIVYESPMTLKDGTDTTISSMEIFRVVDGRITEVWNCGYKQGVWE